MGIQTYEARYSTTGSAPWTKIEGLQDVSTFLGRRRQLDPISASNMALRFHAPNWYASPITALVPGVWIQLRNNTGVSPTVLAHMKLATIDVQYGIPYASSKGAQDYVTLICEGEWATAARAEANSVALASKSMFNQVEDASTASGVDMIALGYQANSTVQATTVTGSWANYLAKMVATINGRVWDAGSPGLGVAIISPGIQVSSTINFSDTANNSTNQVYDRLEFSGYGDNYYTRVEVTPDGLAMQSATKTGASAPYRVLAVDTYNATTSQASDLANYLLTTYQVAINGITAVSCLAEAQTSFQLDQFTSDLSFGNLCTVPGLRVNVTFRGTTIPCVIEGVQVNATPNGSRYTFYVSNAEYNNLLVLDNTVFGKLNSNRLGY